MQGDQGDLDVRGRNIFLQSLSLLSQHLEELTNTHKCCHYNENTLSNINIMQILVVIAFGSLVNLVS